MQINYRTKTPHNLYVEDNALLSSVWDGNI